MKTMAEVIRETQQVEVTGEYDACAIWATPEEIAEVLSAAGFGPVREAQAEALESAADAADDPSPEDMDAYFIDQADVGRWLRARATAITESTTK